ncbi:hypothetical protein BT69DRAFT_1284590 [Atractiella rhizophila]|nr:hypothetical protein BT69DRAFT_1284590 [Atractiella rhizophila]
MAPPMLAPLNTSPGGGAHGNGNGTRKKERRHGHSPTGSLGGAAPPPFILSPSPRAFDPNAKPSTPSTPGHSRNASATSSNHTPSRPHSAASTAGDVTEYSGGKVGVLGGGVKLGTLTTPNSGGIGGRDHHPNGSVGRNGGHGHGHRRAQSSQTGRSGGFHYPSGVMMGTPW